MPPDVLEARINLQLALLRLLAAQTFVQISRQSPRADLLALPTHPVALPRRGVSPSPLVRPISPFGRGRGGGRTR